jgi:hypothetical protein
MQTYDHACAFQLSPLIADCGLEFQSVQPSSMSQMTFKLRNMWTCPAFVPLQVLV